MFAKWKMCNIDIFFGIASVWFKINYVGFGLFDKLNTNIFSVPFSPPKLFLSNHCRICKQNDIPKKFTHKNNYTIKTYIISSNACKCHFCCQYFRVNSFHKAIRFCIDPMKVHFIQTNAISKLISTKLIHLKGKLLICQHLRAHIYFRFFLFKRL